MNVEHMNDNSTFRKFAFCCAKCLLFFTVLLGLATLGSVIVTPADRTTHVVFVDVRSVPLRTVDRKFLSVGLDSSIIAEGFRNFNMSDYRLQKMMQALGPAYFRIGGTMADRLFFDPEANKRSSSMSKFELNALDLDGGDCGYEGECARHRFLPNFTMSGKDWLLLNKLANHVSYQILFDLNALIRYENGTWNSSNAETLIRFSAEKNLNPIWQLGNEPNSFRHVFNYSVNASQLAKDFYHLRNMLNKYDYAILVGPDTTRPRPAHKESELYLKQFLIEGGNSIDVITWHQYYLNGRTATQQDFLSPRIFDMLIKQIQTVKEIAKTSGQELKPIWLGETASAYGGGSPLFSNRYISIFIWTDKLGVAARHGVDVVVRQSIFRGYYALIGDDYEPAPDWWVSVLYKKLVGPGVLSCYAAASNLVRLYCHCTQEGYLFGFPAVTIFGMNMKPTESRIRIEGLFSLDDDFATIKDAFAYVLTPCGSLLSRCIKLNGKRLELLPNGDMPVLQPMHLKIRSYLVMPPYSVAFWVLPSHEIYSC